MKKFFLSVLISALVIAGTITAYNVISFMQLRRDEPMLYEAITDPEKLSGELQKQYEAESEVLKIGNEQYEALSSLIDLQTEEES